MHVMNWLKDMNFMFEWQERNIHIFEPLHLEVVL